jgi:DnaJ-class molecular chaperone
MSAAAQIARPCTEPRFLFKSCPTCRGFGTVARDNFGPSGVIERDARCPRCDGACNVTVERQK